MSYTEPLTTSPEAQEQIPQAAEQPIIDLADSAAPLEQQAAPGKLKAILREVVETLLLAAAIWIVVNFTTARYVVEGQSMEPNLHTGQFLIVNRLAYMQIGGFRLGSVHRGDIVVFDYPGNPSDDYVKRVIGLPGETVEIDEAGRVLVNGTPIEEPYLSTMAGVPYRHRAGTWSVPDGSYFVLGDNRNSSSDSRSWGMLEEQYIVGKAWISYWPPQNWGVIPHYTYATP